MFQLYRKTAKPVEVVNEELVAAADPDKQFEEVASESSDEDEKGDVPGEAVIPDDYHHSVGRVRRGAGKGGKERMGPPKMHRKYDAESRDDPFHDPHNPGPPIAQHLCESEKGVPFETVWFFFLKYLGDQSRCCTVF